jgi:biotin carboxyl carrier protein
MILQVEIGGRLRQVAVERLGSADRFRFDIDGLTLEVSAARVDQRTWSLLLPDGSQHLVAVSGTLASGLTVHLPAGDVAAALPDIGRRRRRRSDPTRGGTSGESGPVRLLAPMAGKVVRILAKAGQAVHAGQGIVVIEAMKMENELRAPRAGIVKEVPAQEGTSVEAGALLAVVE